MQIALYKESKSTNSIEQGLLIYLFRLNTASHHRTDNRCLSGLGYRKLSKTTEITFSEYNVYQVLMWIHFEYEVRNSFITPCLKLCPFFYIKVQHKMAWILECQRAVVKI